jgi:hypothetical protein
VGRVAEPDAQKVIHAVRTPDKLAQYLLKRHPLDRSKKSGTRTSADLLDGAMRGDAESQKLFHELEQAKFNRNAFTPTPGLSKLDY